MNSELRTLTAVPESFSFHLTNLPVRDALFLGEICALFSDPAHASRLALLRSGRLLLARGVSGRLLTLETRIPISDSGSARASRVRIGAPADSPPARTLNSEL